MDELTPIDELMELLDLAIIRARIAKLRIRHKKDSSNQMQKEAIESFLAVTQQIKDVTQQVYEGVTQQNGG